MAEINIDATNALFGRLASYAAKQALLGNKVNILNCEKAVFSGNADFIKSSYHHATTTRGQVNYGPYISRMPDRFFRRVLRGMLPHKRAKGRVAYERLLCYIGVPDLFKGKKLEKLKHADLSNLRVPKYVSLGEVCKAIGGRV